MIFKIFIQIILVLILIRVSEIDHKDDTQPFGTDDERNKIVKQLAGGAVEVVELESADDNAGADEGEEEEVKAKSNK